MAAFTNKKVRKDNSRTLSSPDLPPLSLDRFPPEIRDMILTNIAALPKHHLVDMMITSQQMYHHFGKILYHTLRIDEFNAKSVFKGLLLYTRPDEQPLVFRDEFRKDIDFATASKEMISAHVRKLGSLRFVRRLHVEDFTATRYLGTVLSLIKIEHD